MLLREIEFGPVWGASGVQGFFGEGYKYHKIYESLFPNGFSFDGMTFVAKTTTLPPREGNMPLCKDGITPKEFKPKCIIVKFWEGAGLNAVGLSGPGAKALLKKLRWQARKKMPFFLSWASANFSEDERLNELSEFVRLCKMYFLHRQRGRFGLQLNFSCPNTGEKTAPSLKELLELLDIAAELKVPLVPKLNAIFPTEDARKIAEHPACDALCVSNTIPWGARPNEIDWKGIFGSDVSPIAHLGGGGLSGTPIFPLVVRWLREARTAGIKKPICAGGGILHAHNVTTLASVGAKAISLGSVAMLRPWRVQSIIKKAHEIF